MGGFRSDGSDEVEHYAFAGDSLGLELAHWMREDGVAAKAAHDFYLVVTGSRWQGQGGPLGRARRIFPSSAWQSA